MATFFVQNFGCRATQADAAAIRQSLLARGYSPVGCEGGADLVVLNTCTVTAAADTEAREAIHRIHGQNRRARIIVTGCYAQRAPDELAALEGVSCVVGNSHQSEIASLAGGAGDFFPLAHLNHQACAVAPILRGNIHAERELFAAPVSELPNERTRPTLKIQDGCNRHCSYCVIPFVRGRSRSLSPDQVLRQIRQLAEEGAREIVLSGIDLGSYGRELVPRTNLQGLIRRIVDETPLERLRLSSIEPVDVTQDFVQFISSTDRIAPHFHMPLQSGSDHILRAMHRWYRAAHYARRVEIIRKNLQHAAIGADVIAGFSGETEDDHRLTLRFIEELPLSYLHVFSFSPRPGTEAATLAESVPPETIHQRAQELRSLGAQKAKAFRASEKGRQLRVLTLDRKGENWTGALSENYLKVRIAGDWPRNRWMDAIFDDSDSPLPANPVTD